MRDRYPFFMRFGRGSYGFGRLLISTAGGFHLGWLLSKKDARVLGAWNRAVMAGHTLHPNPSFNVGVITEDRPGFK